MVESISIFLFKMDVLVGSVCLPDRFDTDDEGLETKETTDGVLFSSTTTGATTAALPSAVTALAVSFLFSLS